MYKKGSFSLEGGRHCRHFKLNGEGGRHWFPPASATYVYSYMTLIGVQDMHGQVHPNQRYVAN